KAVNVSQKSERIKNFHHNTLESFFELVGSMGLDSPKKLQPQMLKRRSPYGAQMSTGSLIAPLKANALIDNKALEGSWQQWWESSSAEQFYVNDTYILSPPEFRQPVKS
ncbi:MAG: FMN-binding glutamate synthase family protein, partial [Gammaproteobacteria bacterium]|nr:FMN-binding glutamate synthase family protein [Gammaproteobacteria bacterium]